MRACALTLIAVVEEDGDPEGAAQGLAELMREHPSRTILVRVAGGAEAVLEADVDARCWTPGGGRQICSEQIVLRCSESTLAEAPGVILPLLVPDLPVVLFCQSRRAARSDALGALAEPAGRIILDTFEAPGSAEALAAALDLRRRTRAVVTDLSWTRLTRWRALLAQVFENELYRAQVRYFSRAVVRYEAPERGRVPPTVLLLAGWLVSRLRWDLERVRSGLTFEHQPGAEGYGKLAAFELQSDQSPATRVVITRSSPVCGQIGVEMEGLEPVMNRVALPPSNLPLLLGEELGIRRDDPVFAESLEWAVRISRELRLP
jgi:glucose-6-phosphate dehydrogenase assembly protein OpcA